jgi:hypothetical protein
MAAGVTGPGTAGLPPARRARPNARRAALIAPLLCAALLAGCGIAARTTGPLTPPPQTPAPSVPVAIAQTQLQLEGALRAASFLLERLEDPFRPPESPALSTANRVTYQVRLVNDPGQGQIVVYEFPDTERAASAGREMADYLASGPGQVQFPPDARHVLRQLGTTLIFYTYSRANASSDDVATIATVLDTVGQGIAIPR